MHRVGYLIVLRKGWFLVEIPGTYFQLLQRRPVPYRCRALQPGPQTGQYLPASARIPAIFSPVGRKFVHVDLRAAAGCQRSGFPVDIPHGSMFRQNPRVLCCSKMIRFWKMVLRLTLILLHNVVRPGVRSAVIAAQICHQAGRCQRKPVLSPNIASKIRN